MRSAPARKVSLKTGRFPALVARVLRRAADRPPWNNEELIREELFSAERLEQHA
jgi:hypothetical protein